MISLYVPCETIVFWVGKLLGRAAWRSCLPGFVRHCAILWVGVSGIGVTADSLTCGNWSNQDTQATSAGMRCR
jgi:hypothetical protein